MLFDLQQSKADSSSSSAVHSPGKDPFSLPVLNPQAIPISSIKSRGAEPQKPATSNSDIVARIGLSGRHSSPLPRIVMQPLLSRAEKSGFELESLRKGSAASTKLIAGFFAGNLSKRDRATLASMLLFPDNFAAGQLWEKRLLANLSAREKMKLGALALFPKNTSAARLYLQRAVRRNSLSLPERIELHAAASYPLDPVRAKNYSQELSKFIAPIAARALSEEQIRERLVEFVRRELTNRGERVSPHREILDLFRVNRKVFEQALADPLSGLTQEEKMERAFRLEFTRDEAKSAISVRVLRALRQLVAVENELHRRGVRDVISTREDFAALFGISVSEIKICLRALSPADWRYREKVFGNKEREEAIAKTILKVREDLTRSPPKVRSDTAIAADIQVLPVAVYHYLHETLSEHERRYRDSLMREFARPENHRRSPLRFVREELEAFQLGQIGRMLDDIELGAAFDLSSSQLQEMLHGENSMLSEEEKHLRLVALALPRENDPVQKARRAETLKAVTDRIERALRRATPGYQSRKRNSPPGKRVHAAQPVTIKGVRYDSTLEAALAQVISRPEYLDLTLVQGENVQVGAGRSRFDFFIEGCVIEFHPIRLFYSGNGYGEFDKHEQWEKFKKTIQDPNLSEQGRKLRTAETRAHLLARYAEERRKIARESTRFKRNEVIVCDSVDSFYYQVVARFAPFAPSVERFRADVRAAEARIRLEVQRLGEENKSA